MTRFARSLAATGILFGLAVPALAIDGHGNASNPSVSAPNTGTVSGGPAHRDDPRVQESKEVGRDGKPRHSDKDGHAHGHSHDRK